MVTKPHVITAFFRRGDEAHWAAAEGSTDGKHVSAKMNLPLLLDLAHNDARVILNRWQDFGRIFPSCFSPNLLMRLRKDVICVL